MLRVLIVDDVPIIAELLKAYIGDAAHVELITEGFGFLTDPLHPIWQTTDVLVCDLMMPLISGIHILQMVAEKHEHIRRITLTAAGPGPLVTEAAKVSIVLTKTDDLESIVETILR